MKRSPPRNNNSNFLSPRNSRSTRPLLITRTYIIHSFFPLLVENRRKISNPIFLVVQPGLRLGGRIKGEPLLRKMWPRLFDRLVFRLRSSAPFHRFHLCRTVSLSLRSLCAVKRIAGVSSARGLSSVSVRMRPREYRERRRWIVTFH